MCIQVLYIHTLVFFFFFFFFCSLELEKKKTQLSKIPISEIETSEVSEDSSSLLDTVKVFDLNGNGIPISQLWKDRKAVVAFARHFG